MIKKRPPGVRVVDLSAEVPSASADENNHSRTRIAGFNYELERAHQKINKLERRGEILKSVLRRRTWVLWTVLVTSEMKTGYGMATASWGDQQWWLNLIQAVGLAGAAMYLVTPNVRRLLQLSSETTDLH